MWPFYIVSVIFDAIPSLTYSILYRNDCNVTVCLLKDFFILRLLILLFFLLYKLMWMRTKLLDVVAFTAASTLLPTWIITMNMFYRRHSQSWLLIVLLFTLDVTLYQFLFSQVLSIISPFLVVTCGFTDFHEIS